MLVLPFMLLSGFFGSKVIWFLRPIYGISFFRYAYQAMFLNEYDGLLLECMEIPKEKMGYCDPVGDFDSPQNIEESLLRLEISTIGCLALSYLLMKVLVKQGK
jgi:hypothetical protein